MDTEAVQHSLAPWQMHEGDDYFEVVDANDEQVVMVMSRDSWGRDRCRADMELIASAPKLKAENERLKADRDALLEAAEAALLLEVDDDNNTAARHAEVERLLRAAIEQAKS